MIAGARGGKVASAPAVLPPPILVVLQQLLWRLALQGRVVGHVGFGIEVRELGIQRRSQVWTWRTEEPLVRRREGAAHEGRQRGDAAGREGGLA